MIALWMLYSTLVAGIVGAAAALVERTVGPVVRHRRLIWIAAVLASVGIPPTVAFVQRAPAGPGAAAVVRPAASSATVGNGASLVAGRIAHLIGSPDSRALERLDRPFTIAWVVAAALAFVAYGAASLSIHRRRRTWRRISIEGEPVLLAPAVGPAVVGAVRPEIVVPEWSLDLGHEQRALMIEHERQHVRARDPLLLHAAAFVAMLAPWNVALWWLNRRLRLAVELDCDARVLAGGRDVRAYGTLLLDVCSRRRRPSAVLAPALLERTSSLTRRILAMYPSPVRYARPKAALGTAVALGVMILACEMPTPEMLAPDGSNTATRVFGKASGAGATVNGEIDVAQIVAQYFPAVARGEGDPAVLFVVRSSAGEIVHTEAQAASELSRVRAAGPNDEGSASVTGSVERQRRTRGLPSGISSMNPDAIGTIEVIKRGAGVVAPKPVSVIVITLKPGERMPEAAGQ